MRKIRHSSKITRSAIGLLVGLIAVTLLTSAQAEKISGQDLYTKLNKLARTPGDVEFFEKLNKEAQAVDWASATQVDFQGHLRLIKNKGTGLEVNVKQNVYLVRNINGDLYVLALPTDLSETEKEAASNYAGLAKVVASKKDFKLDVVEKEMEGTTYTFARFSEKPKRLFFDLIFGIACGVMLFSVMIGMGFSLTPTDFKIVFKRPKGIIVGTLIQFGIMPLVAFGLGHALGYVETFPYIFVGMILVTSTPGGATSNLMTHLAKGDVALSVSLTSTASFLCLILTPALLALYCTNIEGVEMPVKTVVLTIFAAVLLPLIIGMVVRKKFETFARRSVPIFSIIGLIAVLTIMIGGVASNINLFKETARDFGAMAWVMLFLLTSLGIIIGIVVPKLFGIGNYQTRAISMEIGIRNVVLGMTIAILIQDYMGDFNSHMFIVSAGFAFTMYIAGGIATIFYKKILPTQGREEKREGTEVLSI